MEKYSVRLDSFEGPMELLMHLIEKNKIDIYDIPIAELTEQYIEYLDQFREFNLEIASEFLLMATTLLQIKSRMMLPKPPKSQTTDETDDIDPRQELIERIWNTNDTRKLVMFWGICRPSRSGFSPASLWNCRFIICHRIICP